jgi:hypothetical protein
LSTTTTVSTSTTKTSITLSTSSTSTTTTKTTTVSTTSTTTTTTKTTQSTTTQSTTTTTPSGYLITEDEFKKALTTNTISMDPLSTYMCPTPITQQYLALVTQAVTKGNIKNKIELAMFLSQIIWESGCLKYTSELACATTNCVGSYGLTGRGIVGKYYFGRGYIQLVKYW